MKNLRNIFTAVLLFVTLFSVKAQEVDNSLLWKIEGNGIKTSYVYGTFHMLPKEDFQFKDKVKNAITASKFIVLELDMDDPAMQADYIKHAAMPEGKTLVEFMDEDEYTLIDTYLKSNVGAGVEQFKNFKPLMVSSMIMMNYLGQDIASYEATIIALAKEQGKDLRGLETVADQINAFDKQTYESQLDDVVKLLNEKEGMSLMFNKMIEIYKNENIEEMYNYMEEYLTAEGQIEALLHNRNTNWIPQIGEYSKEASVFYGVGAGHLGGDKGVVNLLKEAGYTVTPVLD